MEDELSKKVQKKSMSMLCRTWISMKIAKEMQDTDKNDDQDPKTFLESVSQGATSGAISGAVYGRIGSAFGAGMGAVSGAFRGFRFLGFGTSDQSIDVKKMEKEAKINFYKKSAELSFQENVSQLKSGLLPLLTLKEISTDGGCIEGGGCKVSFPANAIRQNCEVKHFTMFGDGLLPDDYILAGRVLALEFPCELRRFVRVEIESFYAPLSGEDVEVSILHLADGATSWQNIQTMRLTEMDVIEFECKSFSVVAAVVRAYHSLVGYRIKSLLYGSGPNFRFFFFCKSSTRKANIIKDMKEIGYAQLFDYDCITVEYNNIFGAKFDFSPKDRLTLRSDDILLSVEGDFPTMSTLKTFDLTLAPKPEMAQTKVVEINSQLHVNSKNVGNKRFHTWKFPSHGSSVNVLNIEKSHIASFNVTN